MIQNQIHITVPVVLVGGLLLAGCATEEAAAVDPVDPVDPVETSGTVEALAADGPDHLAAMGHNRC